jgi:hypothetical protein
VTHPVRLKLELALHGVRAASGAALPLDADAIDLVLPGGVWVSAPVVPRSSIELAAEGEQALLAFGNGAPGLAVRVVRRPRFVERRTSHGVPMGRIASVHGRHLVVHPGTACGLSVRGAPCRFCVEGARGSADREIVPVGDVVETVRAAFAEGFGDAVYFNTGVFDAEDGGIGFLAPYIEAVRRHFDTFVATQVHPPRTNAWIDRTYAMGVDAISYNLEIFDAEALKRTCVGRARYIGRERYLEALAHAAQVFPRGTVWSDLVLGLEPFASTVAGIDALAAMGVVPVVSLAGATTVAVEPADAEPVLAHLYRAVKQRGTAMGWVRDLAAGIAPIEARHFAGDDARLAVTVQNLTRSRVGALAARGLARMRRRLRVRTVSDGFGAAHS